MKECRTKISFIASLFVTEELLFNQPEREKERERVFTLLLYIERFIDPYSDSPNNGCNVSFDLLHDSRISVKVWL